MSLIRQNFNKEVEARINMQINMELRASYIYHSIAIYFDRDDIGLYGFSKFFQNSSTEERHHAEKLMKYMNKRGGRLFFQNIKKPDQDEWGTGLDALIAALKLEKEVNKSLLECHVIAGSKNDPHFCDFLESEFLSKQVESIKVLSDMITQLKRAGSGLGEYQFDKDLKSSMQ